MSILLLIRKLNIIFLNTHKKGEMDGKMCDKRVELKIKA